MPPTKNLKYTVDLSYREIRLPPVDDILVLAKYSSHGMIGISKSFELLVPNGFETIEVTDEKIEAVFVNKRILSKVPLDVVLEILRERIFPFIAEGDILQVDFKVLITYPTFTHQEANAG